MLPEDVAGPEKRQLALYPSTAADPSSFRKVSHPVAKWHWEERASRYDVEFSGGDWAACTGGRVRCV